MQAKPHSSVTQKTSVTPEKCHRKISVTQNKCHPIKKCHPERSRRTCFCLPFLPPQARPQPQLPHKQRQQQALQPAKPQHKPQVIQQQVMDGPKPGHGHIP